VVIGLYVDDLILVGPSMNEINKVKNLLSSNFNMVDLGPAKYVLGIQVVRGSHGEVKLTQEAYAKEVLKRFGMENCKSVSTPIVPSPPLSKEMSPQTEEEREQMKVHPYRRAVGSLMDLMTGTRPDLATAVSQVSRYSQDPGEAHWQAVKRILRYLQGTVSLGLVYHRGESKEDGMLLGYCDADLGESIIGDAEDIYVCEGARRAQR